MTNRWHHCDSMTGSAAQHGVVHQHNCKMTKLRSTGSAEPWLRTFNHCWTTGPVRTPLPKSPDALSGLSCRHSSTTVSHIWWRLGRAASPASAPGVSNSAPQYSLYAHTFPRRQQSTHHEQDSCCLHYAQWPGAFLQQLIRQTNMAQR